MSFSQVAVLPCSFHKLTMSAIYKVLSGRSSKAEAEKKSHINRQRVLLISSRGITYRHRYLINDLYSLLPHSRKEPKLDTKKQLNQLNEIAELYNCNNILYFECRKHTDLYMWLSKPPNGPTIKFFVQNIHNTEELNFTGNALKGSRPILSFDGAFDDEPQLKLMKEMFTHTFGVPPTSRKVKPFIDHVMSFSVVDGKIWIRNYQILEQAEDVKNRDDSDVSLVEIGPRLVLTPIVILEGSFGGPKIYENKQYVSPNFVRAQVKQQAAEEARARHEAAQALKLKKRDNVLAVDPLSNEALFKAKK